MTAQQMTTIEQDTLYTRAAFVPSSVNEEARTIDIVWTTGARGLRRRFFGDDYMEELAVDETSVRLERLNAGANVLNSHHRYDVRDVIGVVERAWLEKGEGMATIRFSDREDVEPIWRDVRSGILRNFSVGYNVHRWERIRSEKEGELDIMRAVDWEPMELSLVSVPFDAGAQARSDHGSHRAVIIDRGDDAAEPGEEPNGDTDMADENSRAATASEPAATQPTEQTRQAAAPAEPAQVNEDEIRKEERQRATDIRRAVRAAGLADDLADDLINRDVPIDEARAAIIDRLADEEERTQPQTRAAHVTVESEPRDHLRAGVEQALLHRYDAQNFELDERGRQFAGVSLVQVAERYLDGIGIKTRGMSNWDVVSAAMGLDHQRISGPHGTSDFPFILADVANKTLRRAYQMSPRTFQPVARRTTLPDFRPAYRTQFGEAPQLLEVLPSGEFTRGTVGEARESYKLSTYGRIISVNRQVLINDDMDAFTRVPELFGASAADLESDVVWGIVNANAAMGDGIALFHADHGNLAGSGAAISVTSIGLGRAAMRKQKALDKKKFINVTARYLVVPADIETVADQFVSQNLLADAAGNVNPFAGRLQVIAEPRLGAGGPGGGSASNWYLFADPAQVDTIEYAYLMGQEGVFVESRMGFDVDGLEIKARHDFAAKAIDWRGMYKNPH